MTDAAWEPGAYHREESNVARFLEEYGYDGRDDLVPDDEAHLARLWGDFADDTGIVWQEPYDEVLDTSDGYQFADWYTGGGLNVVETILDQWAERTPDADMYVWTDEQGDRSAVTYAEMQRRTNELANAFRNYDLGRGDVVGVTFPMHPNGFVACLAALRVGAAFTMIFPGYGRDAMRHRLEDAGASFLVTADAYTRDGEVVDLQEKVDTVVSELPDLTNVVVYDHHGREGAVTGAQMHDWDGFVADSDDEAETATMRADDTAFVAYSSGTTGTPKGTVHSHAALAVMGNKEMRYHFDVSQDDTLLWVTDFGWVIVPVWMLAGAPALGATTVLMEGSPTAPTDDRVWQVVAEHGVTVFGISPSGARGLRQLDEAPRESHDLSSLRVLGSTGEPWDEAGWRWFLDAVGGGDAPIINASGGTEVCGAILVPTPLDPLKPGTLAGPAPGVAANIYDEDGTPADEGYLVVELPIPGMTNGLTDGDERYLDEYWRDFEGVWNQNDWAERDADGFWYITGRADDTMNVAGRRVTAPAIEEVVAEHSVVEEATVVPVPDETKGEVPVAFVVPFEGADTEGLEQEVRDLVDEELGAPFRPADVHTVPGLPRTQTEKVTRGVIEATYLGEEVGDTSTLDGAEALEEYPRRED
jgi:acetyl-CoA synthetase